MAIGGIRGLEESRGEGGEVVVGGGGFLGCLGTGERVASKHAQDNCEQRISCPMNAHAQTVAHEEDERRAAEQATKG